MALNEVPKFIPSVDEMATELIARIKEPSMKINIDNDFLSVIFSFCSDCEFKLLYSLK